MFNVVWEKQGNLDYISDDLVKIAFDRIIGSKDLELAITNHEDGCACHTCVDFGEGSFLNPVLPAELPQNWINVFSLGVYPDCYKIRTATSGDYLYIKLIIMSTYQETLYYRAKDNSPRPEPEMIPLPKDGKTETARKFRSMRKGGVKGMTSANSKDIDFKLLVKRPRKEERISLSKEFYKDLGKGQSIVVKGRKEANRIYTSGRNHGFRTVQRSLGDGTYRIWFV